MREYAIRRVLLTIPTLLGLSIILFGLLRLLPGDAALLQAAGGEDILNDPEALEALRRNIGIDKPVVVQYLVWIGGVVRGDFGTSFWTGEPAGIELLRRLPVTIELGVLSIFTGLVLGIIIGVISAIYQDRPLDYLGRLFGIGGISVPNFWVGTLLIVLPALWFGYLPPLGYVPIYVDPWANMKQFVPPALALGWALSASVQRMCRSQMLEVLRQDYIRTARAKGLGERVVIYRHALKNALIPVITIAGLQAGFLLGGTVVIEAVYGLPGIGTLTLRAITQRDYPLIQTSVLFLAAAYVFINLFVDLAYGWLDPRIRYT